MQYLETRRWLLWVSFNNIRAFPLLITITYANPIIGLRYPKRMLRGSPIAICSWHGGNLSGEDGPYRTMICL